MIRTQCFQCQGLSLIPGQVTKSLQAMRSTAKKEKNRIFFNFWLCYFFLAVCGLFSSCTEWGLLSSYIVQASHSSGFPCC